MGIFEKLLGTSGSPASGFNWNKLDNVSQIGELTALSRERSVLIFKHSTRCGISRMTLKRFEAEFDLAEKVTPYLLDLLAYRDVSNAVSFEFDIVHQSPQILLIKDGKCVFAASHEAIDAAQISRWIESPSPDSK